MRVAKKSARLSRRSVNGFSKAIVDALAKMETSDSFVYTDDTEGKNKNRTVRAIARGLGVKVTVRDVGNNTFRVWKLN